MHGVHAAVRIDGAAAGYQGLRQHLAAKDALPGLLLGGTHEDVLVRPGALELAEVEKFDERGGGVLGREPQQSGFGFSHGLTLDGVQRRSKEAQPVESVVCLMS